MWAPNDVVPHHKRRATCLWVCLIITIVGYSVQIFVAAYRRRSNPGITLKLEDGRYSYPTVTVCIHAEENGTGYGCDYWSYSCASVSAADIMAVGGFVMPEDDYNATTPNEAYPDQCLDFRLSELEETSREGSLWPPYVQILLMWTLGPHEDYVADYQDSLVEEISSTVNIFWSDPTLEDPLGDHGESNYIGNVPYTRVQAGTVRYNFTQTTIHMEMTETVDLDRKSTRTYFAGTLTPSELHYPAGFDLNLTVGALFLDIFQPALSHTIRKAIDPLEPLELLGNIGGMWEFLLIVWSLAFMAARQEEPKLKGRNLKKSAQKGVRTVQSVALRGKSSTSSQGRTAFNGEEEIPAWEREARQSSTIPAPTPAFNPNADNARPPAPVGWGSAAVPNASQGAQKVPGNAAMFGRPGTRIQHDASDSDLNSNDGSGRSSSVATSGHHSAHQPLSRRKPVPLGGPLQKPPSYRTSVSTPYSTAASDSASHERSGARAII